MLVADISQSESLLTTSIPDDWFRRIFDRKYYLVDLKRKSTDLTYSEAAWIEGLVPDTLHPLTILDVGCGYGRHIIELSKRGHRVVGIDQSSDLLEIARSNSQAQGVGVDLIEGDFRQLPNGFFDIVMLMHTSFGYFHEDSENKRFFCELVSHVRPGGFLLLQQRRCSSLPMRPTVDERFTLHDGNLRYNRFSVFSNKCDMWHGAYKYVDRCSSDTQILPYCIRLYRTDVFSQWLSSCESKCHLSLHKGYPNSPAEEMYLIKKTSVLKARGATI